MNVEREVASLQSQVDRLGNELDAMKQLAVSQAAMVALLSAMLAGKEILTKQEAVLIATAGQEAQTHEKLTPEQVQDWIRKHLEGL